LIQHWSRRLESDAQLPRCAVELPDAAGVLAQEIQHGCRLGIRVIHRQRRPAGLALDDDLDADRRADGAKYIRRGSAWTAPGATAS
jgi:hypothetical protein